MDDLLRDFGAIIPLTIVAIPFALLGWRLLANWRKQRRPARSAGFTAAVDAIITVLLSLVLCLVTMPVSSAQGSLIYLTPGTDIEAAFRAESSVWQLIGNLILLAPLGALLPLRVRALRSLTRVTMLALVTSMLIEGGQLLIQAGRVTSIDDVLLNTLGASLGAWLTGRWWRSIASPPIIPVQQRRHVQPRVLPPPRPVMVPELVTEFVPELVSGPVLSTKNLQVVKPDLRFRAIAGEYSPCSEAGMVARQYRSRAV